MRTDRARCRGQVWGRRQSWRASVFATLARLEPALLAAHCLVFDERLVRPHYFPLPRQSKACAGLA